MQQLLFVGVCQHRNAFVEPVWRLPALEALCDYDMRELMWKCRKHPVRLNSQVDSATHDLSGMKLNEAAARGLRRTRTRRRKIGIKRRVKNYFAARIPSVSTDDPPHLMQFTS